MDILEFERICLLENVKLQQSMDKEGIVNMNIC